MGLFKKKKKEPSRQPTDLYLRYDDWRREPLPFMEPDKEEFERVNEGIKEYEQLLNYANNSADKKWYELKDYAKDNKGSIDARKYVKHQIKKWYGGFITDPDEGISVYPEDGSLIIDDEISRTQYMNMHWEYSLPVIVDVMKARGREAGMLLETPVPNGVDIKHRGIRQDWLYAFVNNVLINGRRMSGEAPRASRNITTRVFMGCLGKLLGFKDKIPLIDFVPEEFRGKPDVFLSHSWDGNTEQAFQSAFLWQDPSSDKRKRNDEQFVWIDMFCINQHEPGQADKIPECIEACPKGVCVYLPGGFKSRPKELLRNFYRSWCVYEIVVAEQSKRTIDMKVAITHEKKIEDYEAIVAAIGNLNVEDATATSDEDRENIINEITKEDGGTDKFNKILRDIAGNGCYLAIQMMLDSETVDYDEATIATCKEALELFKPWSKQNGLILL